MSRLAAQTAEWTLTTTISWWNRSIGNRIAQTIRAAGLGDSSEQVSLRLLMETFSLPYNSVGQEGTEAGMAQGVVKWFNAEKGIGFIAPDGGGPDVFVYNSAVDVDGYRKLAEGARVEFDAHAGGKDSLALKAVGGAPSTAMMAKVLGVGEARPAVKESRVIHTRRPTLPLANHRAAFLIETFGGCLGPSPRGVQLPAATLECRHKASEPSAQQLLDMDHVSAKAMMIWPRLVALQWLSSPSPALGGAQPLELVLQGRAPEVVEELEALEQGAIR